MVKGGQRREEHGRVHNPLPKAGWKNIHEVLPPRILEVEGRDKQVAEHHQASAYTDKSYELPPPRHHNACDQSPDGRRQGRDGQPGTSLSGCIQEDDLEEERQVKQILVERSVT